MSMRIFKEGQARGAGAVSGKDLELINALSRKELAEGEVFTFSLILCDNEVDRDFERFDVSALEELAGLFAGRTGISDHDWSSARQVARIYRTELVREPDRLTAAGEEYVCLKAWAYMLRTAENETLIAEIEGGIKKETSVGVSMRRSVCSICGEESGSCGHVKGQEYGGKVCHAVLRGAADAYEWSFVAVPAQPRAGVVKGRMTAPLTALEKAMARGDSLTLAPGEAAELARWAGELEKAAEEGRAWREKAVAEAVRLGRLSCPGLSRELLEKALRPLDAAQLEEWTAEHRRRAARRLPLPQTAPSQREEGETSRNDPFKV